MESLDILILGVEASIALAGFAGIIATFQFGEGKVVKRADAVALSMIVQFSLVAALACSTAIILYSFSVRETTMWAICSVLSAIIGIGALYAQLSNSRGVARTKFMVRLILTFESIAAFMVMINILNASNIFFNREAGPFVASIVWPLCIAAFMFSRLLLRPVWRNVRLQEAANLADATSS
jgi:hypothetical protein